MKESTICVEPSNNTLKVMMEQESATNPTRLRLETNVGKLNFQSAKARETWGSDIRTNEGRCLHWACVLQIPWLIVCISRLKQLSALHCTDRGNNAHFDVPGCKMLWGTSSSVNMLTMQYDPRRI